ncbi:MAG: hypothetical protein JAZ11_09895 [Candidatus Thiodiazotropha lotti]|nr:hypothetical protein [Candidatus Thiodiazotropha lotti]
MATTYTTDENGHTVGVTNLDMKWENAGIKNLPYRNKVYLKELQAQVLQATNSTPSLDQILEDILNGTHPLPPWADTSRYAV